MGRLHYFHQLKTTAPKEDLYFAGQRLIMTEGNIGDFGFYGQDFPHDFGR